MASAAWAAAITTPRLPPKTTISSSSCSSSFRCRAEISPFTHGSQGRKKKVVVVGSGWAAFGSAHHLTKQGFDVTVLGVGSCEYDEVGVGGDGFWFSYQNIYSLMDELGIKPFTKWTKSAQYSPRGLEVEFRVFWDSPRLPTPLGVFLYPQFNQLPLLDRLTAVPLMVAAIDFDNTDTTWRKYDAMTARELFKQFGCSNRLFQEVFDPMVQVGVLAPAERCSAAATLGMLYYFVLAHQQNFDVMWCRGTIRNKIFHPWQEYLKAKGVVCEEEVYESDAVVVAVGISTLQSIVANSFALRTKEFLNILNLSAIDVVSVKLWMDRKVDIPTSSNVGYGFDDLTAWTFSDLSSIYDEYKDETSTVIKADFDFYVHVNSRHKHIHLQRFKNKDHIGIPHSNSLSFFRMADTNFIVLSSTMQYHASQLLPLKDEQIVVKVLSYLSQCIKEFEECTVLQQVVTRFPNSATHFFPGSYKYMMRGSTSIPNLVMAGDWIVTRHGSWSQEKAYVTGLEAANRVVDHLGIGEFAKIIAVEEDESHIEMLRGLNRSFNEIRSQIPFN